MDISNLFSFTTLLFFSTCWIPDGGFSPPTKLKNCRSLKQPLEIKSYSPAKVDSVPQVAQVGVQIGLESLRRRRLHNLTGQSFPAFCHSNSGVLHCFMLVWNFPCVGV